MSTAGVAAQEIRGPLKTALLHNGPAMGSVRTCWGRRRELENNFLNIDPITMAYRLNSPAQGHLTALGHTSKSPVNGHYFAENGPSARPSLPPLIIPPSEGVGQREEDQVVCGVKKLSVNGVCASTPPLTPMKNPLPSSPVQLLGNGVRGPFHRCRSPKTSLSMRQTVRLSFSPARTQTSF